MQTGITKANFFLSLMVGCCFALTADAQKPTPTPAEESEVIRVDTEMIDVPVVVNDKTGKPVLDLKLSNFRLLEDGKPQEITDFSATTAPFEVALLLDTSGSTRSEIDLIKRAAQVFVDSLRPGDKVAIISFGSGDESSTGSASAPVVVSKLTDDRNALRSALQRITVSNGTPFYDGLIKVGESIFPKRTVTDRNTRRAIVALTDGVDSTSSSEFEEVSEIFGEEGIVSYFIRVDTREYFESELLGDCQSAIRFSQAQIRRYYRTVRSRSNERATNFCQLGDFERLAVSKSLYELADMQMNALAQTSGGKVFPLGDLSEARNAFRSVAAEIGTNYSLGYYSSNEKRDGSFRKITVELKGLPAGSKVRAREGYTAKTN
jgi:Ca-activated chloride channel family protein